MNHRFPPPGIKVFGVGELTRNIKRLLEDAHGTVWVEGEVSNLARPASGHQYLTLKDEESPLRCMLGRAVALRMRFNLQDGMHVIARGRLTVFAARGEYQLQIEEVQPKGIGALELAFRQAEGTAVRQGLLQAGAQEEAAAHPAARGPGCQRHGFGGARRARGARPALAGCRGLGGAGPGAGRGRARGNRRRHPAPEPDRRSPHPRAALPSMS